MRDIDQVVDRLIEQYPDGFRMKELATALGVSRSRASRLVKPRLLTGELSRDGEGRATRLFGRRVSSEDDWLVRRPSRPNFWRDLSEECPRFSYVALDVVACRVLRTREQVRAALKGLEGCTFLVLDFAGIEELSHAAADELFVRIRHWRYVALQPINVSPSVAKVIARAVRLGELATNP